MKKLIPDSFIRVIILMTAFIIVLHTGSGAESVFMKNGAITEGRITESNDKEITIALNTGEVRTVGRKDITRILMHSRFREKIPVPCSIRKWSRLLPMWGNYMTANSIFFPSLLPVPRP